ncbi:MAG: hypothetical protein ACP5HQ_05370 [Thermoprotei archaeon]
MNLIERYLSDPPKEKLTYLGLEVPCDLDCLKSTEYRDLTGLHGLSESLEVFTYMKMLIEERTNELTREVGARLQGFDVDPKAVAYAVFWSRKLGDRFSLGEGLAFDGYKIFEGTFEDSYALLQRIQQISRDPNVADLCAEIDNLTESLWTHFEKNVRRAAHEATNRGGEPNH